MTLLAGDGSDYDYSALSCASESSLSGPALHQERQALKGTFYQRAQLLPLGKGGGEVPLPSARKLHAIINVGGLRYQLPWTTLEDFPLTRLGQLRACSNFDEIMRVCDDYDVTCNEFFFDRNPCAFRNILTFLRAGKLRALRETCALSFREELLYWGIPEECLEWCCHRRLLQRIEECEELDRAEEEELLEAEGGLHEPLAQESWHAVCMGRLRDMVERPHSGLPGKIFACLSVLFVTITAINLSISTMPAMRQEEEEGKCSQMCYNIFIVETVCVAWFSLEFTLRFIQDRSKLAFLRRPLNLIDVVAILPYYITLVVDGTSEGDKRLGSGSSYLDKVGLVLRVLRALRILYVMRLARHSLGLQTLGLTARRCTREFGLLLLFLCVAIALFSPLLYLTESEAAVGAREFSSIPATYWWAVITMTTVGYGDMVPRSVPGQVVALSSILSGILLMAFPVTSIFHTFSRSYVELKQEQQRLLQRRTHFLLRNRITDLSNLSLESDALFPSGSSCSEPRETDD
ncbi:potassium voltage-gated channel subfamily G member 1 [Paramormyrops kingsleyae]|uniref:Potassium voltage-gated channel, subfamily G, member 1 n=1 Tax=Paramormyrops kingsleyae TaxID=1676925 RepID=A0A3B3RZM7_9TELE|nr:potassium voltage-gated channel subfamily G member 1 [Paramormyrops kingsleyae]XP_023690669.1 potassium voltage-gated channel subfamily G member 1 [Paramormyrops kingsleyae]XP_023690670.1 potassium voltage-gated channel subfamily G member 1 [Paramormyrops kingsleyae]